MKQNYIIRSRNTHAQLRDKKTILVLKIYARIYM